MPTTDLVGPLVDPSFGHPACSRLRMQNTLSSLIHLEKIGVTLTEDFMMEPEASVAVVVFRHPDGKYFSAGEELVA